MFTFTYIRKLQSFKKEFKMENASLYLTNGLTVEINDGEFDVYRTEDERVIFSTPLCNIIEVEADENECFIQVEDRTAVTLPINARNFEDLCLLAGISWGNPVFWIKEDNVDKRIHYTDALNWIAEIDMIEKVVTVKNMNIDYNH